MSKRAAGYKYKGDHKGSAKKATGNRGACSADAHSQNDWKDVGGHNADSLQPGKPVAGIGSAGGSVHHAAPKSKQNISPPNAHSYASFSPKAPKSTNEY
jgi:hypothetical protein